MAVWIDSNNLDGDRETLYVCSNCGYLNTGLQQECKFCKAKREYTISFSKAMELIEKHCKGEK